MVESIFSLSHLSDWVLRNYDSLSSGEKGTVIGAVGLLTFLITGLIILVGYLNGKVWDNPLVLFLVMVLVFSCGVVAIVLGAKQVTFSDPSTMFRKSLPIILGVIDLILIILVIIWIIWKLQNINLTFR